MRLIGVFVPLFFGLVTNAIAIPSALAASLSGVWDWCDAPDTQTFSIQLEQHGRELVGQYCAVARSGNKIDCDVDKNLNIHGVLNEEGSVAVVDFFSFFGGKNGQAELSLDGESLMWHVLQRPVDGPSYAPDAARLMRH